MARKSKPFVIATEGQTVDGRNISRQWIEQMAANYQADVYTAVVNLEHYLSMLPDSPFSAYGRVVALSTREKEIFGQKRLQLLATVEASEAAVAIQQEGKKCFASIEVIPNFTGRGEAYLTGLALTDTPASLGTEPMRFSVFSNTNDNVFAFPGETELAFESDTPGPEDGNSLFARVKALIGMTGKNTEKRFADIVSAIEELARAQKEIADAFDTFVANDARDAEEMKRLASAFAAIKSTLAATPATPARPFAAGGDGTIKTDC
jgi:hypothetical protein